MIQARSTYGRRGAICEKFGWTLDYLEHGISWARVIRILCDLPRYEYDSKPKKTKLTADNAQEFMNLINNF